MNNTTLRKTGLSSSAFQVGKWRVEPTLNRIFGPEGTKAIEPKIMEVLICLVENAGQVVTPELLVERVWGGAHIGSDVIPRAISMLRKVFDDDWSHPLVIETVRKKGYRFVATATSPSSVVPSSGDSLVSKAGHRLSSKAWFLMMTAAAVLVVTTTLWFWTSPSSSESPVLRPLSTFPGPESHPAISPDGRQVAFVWSGAKGDNEDVYLRLVDDGAPIRLTTHPFPDVHPVWIGQGNRVAFLRRHEDGESLFVVDIYGQQERKLLDLDAYGGFDWSPDGKTLAVSEKRLHDQRFRLYIISIETLDRRSLPMEGIEKGNIFDPVFSPDGAHLAFEHVHEGRQEICIAPVEGGSLRCLRQRSHSLAWGPRGRHLLFTSDRSGSLRLWRIPISGGSPHPVDLGQNEIVEVSVARESGRVVYTERFRDLNIWRSRIDWDSASVQAPTLMMASTRSDSQAQYSPDGGRIAFVSNRSGHFELWVSDSNGASADKLTDLKASFLGSPSWAPSGTSIAFACRLETTADLYLIDTDSIIPRQLTRDPFDEVSPSWSRDGQWIYFTSNRFGEWEVFKMPAAGGPVVQLTQAGGYGAVESADSRSFFYSNKGHLWRKSLKGDEQTRLVQVPSGNWTLMGDEGVIFEQYSSGENPRIAFYRFDDGRSVELMQPKRAIPEGGRAISVSPDGKWLLYGQIDNSETDMMLAERLVW